MKRWLPLCLLLFLVAAPGISHAQVSLSGTVLDQASHAPVVGASVTVPGTGVGATTDEGGKFTLSSDKDFTSIVVSRVGYQKKEVAVTDKSQPLTIQLVPAAVQMKGYEVTGRAVAKDQLNNSQSVGTLAPQDLNRASGLSLENSINTLPGVQMQSRTPWGGAHIQIRGYYPNFSQNSNGYGLQTYLNDIPVTDASGFTVMDDIDFTSLGSVEVIKGPASSQYGSFIAGTVNFHTATPAPGQKTLDEGMTGGSYKLFRNNVTYMGAGDNSAVVLNYGHQTYDSFRPHSISKKDFARFSGDFHAGPNQTVSTYFSYNNSFEELSGEIDSADFVNNVATDNPVYALNHSHIQIESSRLGATDDYKFNSTLSTKSTVFVTTQAMSQPFAHGFTNTNRFNFGARSVFEYQSQGPGTKFNGFVGGQFQRTNYTANGFSLNSGNPSDQENYAMNYYGFTEWNVELPSRFIVTVGASLNQNEFGIRNLLKNKMINDTTRIYVRAFDPTFTPRVSVLKNFNEQVSLYGSVSTGYTPPSLSSIIASDNSINTALKPEKAVQVEFGSKGSLMDKKFSYDVAVFQLNNTDKLVSQKVGAVTSTVNVGEQRDKGLEATVSYLVVDDPSKSLSLVRPWASLTASDFKYIDFKSDNNNTAATVDFSGNTVARVPKTIYNIGLDVATNYGMYLYASYQHVGKSFVTFDNSTSVAGYGLLNAKAGYTRKLAPRWALDLSAGGDNLTGSTYYSYIFVGPNIKGLEQSKDGGTGDGFILPGPYKATVYGGAKVTYTF